jgi:hypothetical protein
LSGPVRVAIVADTHLSGGRALPARCAEIASGCDAVIHAGDFSDGAALESVRGLGPPLHAVHGNVDSAEVRAALPERAEVTIAGVRFAIVHDAGAAQGRLERMRREFPKADVVVFGHSHMPLHEQASAAGGPFQIFNPGSPTQRRRAPGHTIGIAVIENGTARLRHVDLD